MRSFDSVSIDSDLDSVCTEQIRLHIHRRPGERPKKMWRRASLIMKKHINRNPSETKLLVVQN